MTALVTPTAEQIFATLRSLILTALPSGTPVFKGQGNRVPEPTESDFVEMTPILRSRLGTTLEDYLDCLYVGSISGITLTVTSVSFGTISVGSPVYGVNVADGTTIESFGTGNGGVGTYNLSVSQTIASGTLASGVTDLTLEQELVVQIDAHGPNSGDNIAALAALLRSDYGAELMASYDYPMGLLYADEAQQVPFSNDQQQYEYKWTLDAHLQVNQTLSLGQQFADAVTVGLINVDAAYPP